MKACRSHDGDADIAQARQALDWAVADGSAGTLAQDMRRSLRIRRVRRQILSAAGVIAFAFTAGVVTYWRIRSDAGDALPPSAIVSAPAMRNLPDGSIVELKDGFE